MNIMKEQVIKFRMYSKRHDLEETKRASFSLLMTMKTRSDLNLDRKLQG
jgi:hypothetical protein